MWVRTIDESLLNLDNGFLVTIDDLSKEGKPSFVVSVYTPTEHVHRLARFERLADADKALTNLANKLEAVWVTGEDAP